MQIPGHIAIAVAQHTLPPFAKEKRALLILIISSLFPDIVDKTIGYILNAMPNGRHYAHNIFSLVGTSLLVGLIWGKRAGYTWFAGYLGHLVVDTRNLVPWFFPIQNYHFKKGRLSFKPVPLLKETLFLSLVLIIHRLRHS